MRVLLFLSAVLATAVLAAGCGGGDSDEPALPAGTTADNIRTAVYERSLSECASYSLDRLSGKYRVAKQWPAVATAVGRQWTKFFSGGSDAVAVGRDGCLQGKSMK